VKDGLVWAGVGNNSDQRPTRILAEVEEECAAAARRAQARQDGEPEAPLSLVSDALLFS
jgi:hypothetical protein